MERREYSLGVGVFLVERDIDMVWGGRKGLGVRKKEGGYGYRGGGLPLERERDRGSG